MSAARQLKPVFTTGIQHKLHRLLRFGEMALSGAQIGDNARTNYLQTPVVIASLIIATALVALRILKILYQPAPAGQFLLLLLLEVDSFVAQDSTAAVCLCMFHAPNANVDVATSLTALLAAVGS